MTARLSDRRDRRDRSARWCPAAWLTGCVAHVDRYAKRVPSDWEKSTQKKGVIRFTTEKTRTLVGELEAAQEAREEALRGVFQVRLAAGNLTT